MLLNIFLCFLLIVVRSLSAGFDELVLLFRCNHVKHLLHRHMCGSGDSILEKKISVAVMKTYLITGKLVGTQ